MNKGTLQPKRVLCSTLFVLLMMAGMTKAVAQQPNQIKLTDYNFHNLSTIEERVFLLHSIEASDFFSYALSDEEGKIDIYVSDSYTCQDSNANSDFEFFLENIYDEWTAYSNLDKTERGSLFVEWRYQLEDEVFLAINEDFNRQLRDGNATCDGAIEFSSENGVYQFPSSINAGNLGSSTPPYYCSGFIRPTGSRTSCLSTTPNPAFYYFQIAEPGNLNIYMYSTPSHDIDFDCWGPFDEIESACNQLSCNNLVDCSYSANATENCYINNAQSGEFYILLITNYSNQSGTVYFQNVGTGSTGCSGQKTVTANVNSNGGGTVTGGGIFDCGSSCTLTATANNGYVFMDWTNENGEVVSTEEEYTFLVWGNRNITANFVEDNACYLSFNLNDSNGDGWTGNYLVLNFEDGSYQRLTLSNGLSVSYSLPIADGSHFSLGWSSGVNPDHCSFTVRYSNGSVICYGTDLDNNFNYEFDVDCIGMPGSFIVTATANPAEGGTITITDLTMSVGGAQSTSTFSAGETCTMTASPNYGYAFENWMENGNIISTDAEISFVVTGNRDLVANFTKTPFTITATPNFANRGTVTGAGEYVLDDTCTLAATANVGYAFANWTHDGTMVSTDAEYSFIVTGELALVANFVSAGNIVFADANVKSICVAHWDTNSDGELSYAEAANVTDLVNYFQGNTEILMFNELQYFTGLSSIGDYAFQNCSGLILTTLPNAITAIGNYAFYGCSGLIGGLTIPNSVITIGNDCCPIFYVY